MWQVWLVICGLFFILEIITVGFLVFWFGIGALFAMITSFFTDNVVIQTSVFLVTSTGLLFLIKKFFKKVTGDDKIQTNAYSAIGKTGIVTVDINSKTGVGQVKIGSEIWSAKTNDDTILPVGCEVEVIQINGVKAIVKPVKELVTN